MKTIRLTIRPIISIILAISFVTVATAQDKVTEGVSPKAAKELLRVAKKNAEAFAAKQRRQQSEFQKGLASDLAAQRAAVAAQLKKQPEFVSYSKEHDALLSKAKGKKLSKNEVRDLSAALAKLDNAHKRTFVAAYKAANIDERTLVNVIKKRLEAFTQPFAIESAGLGTYKVVWSNVSESAVAGETCLRPPYANDDTSEHEGGIIDYNDARANAHSGRIILEGGAIEAGNADDRGIVGSYFTAPAGFAKIKITATVKVDYSFSVGAFLAGAGAGGDILIEVSGIDSQVQVVKQNLDSVVAAVFWSTKAEGTATRTVTTILRIPQAGGEFLVRAGATTNFWSGGVACWSYASDSATVTKICVELLR